MLNELMSSNGKTLADEDGDRPDWIELLNPTAETVDLTGYSLTDDTARPFKWRFPAQQLTAGERLVIFASNKDRREMVYWQTLIDRGDHWRYFRGTKEPPADWTSASFNDAAWPQGRSGFGFGDNDDATIIENVLSVYVRKTFTVDDPQAISQAVLHVDYDDGFIAYLNGQEIARANMGSPGEFFAFNQPATAGHEALIYQGQSPEAFAIPVAMLRRGVNVSAIQVHNINSTSSDLTLIPFLTLGLKQKPANGKPAPDILNLGQSHLHTNFKLNAASETVALFAPNGTVVDSVRVPALSMDISYGRVPDAGESWGTLAVPTPGAPNAAQLHVGQTAPPRFSLLGGFYTKPISLELSADGVIVYTLDGSEPNERAPRYTKPLSISQTTVVRARTLSPPMLPGPIAAHTFIFNENSPFAVLSLTTDPDNLFDYETGIFESGPNAQNDYPYFGANFWQDWERPVHVEFFEPNGRLGFELDAGMKVFGGWSRGRPQKSLAIFQRRYFDDANIEYRIFADKEIDRFESFLLRNGGNDWDGTYWRDGFMQTLCRDFMDLETMAFRPAHIYLNGDYWGILNIREKLNEHFVAANRGVDPDRVDVLDGSGTEDWQALAGSTAAYRELLNFINSHNLADPRNYAVVDSLIDIDNFIDYQIAEQFIGNTDWPGNNIKFYRPHHPGGKWRWLIYDTDFGFHLYDTGPEFNMLTFAAQTNGPGWPNPPWSTLLFRKLLENETFRLKFINRFADHLNTTFEPTRVKGLLTQFDNLFKSQINRQRRRWPGSMSGYSGNLQRMLTFADRRIPSVRTHIRNYFKLGGLIDLTLDVQGRGAVQVNSVVVHQFPWRGVYFQGVPITLTAVPDAGQRFVRWSAPELPNQMTVSYPSNAGLTAVAVFEPATEPVQAVINEINYNSSSLFKPKDWLELYNPTRTSISLAGWTLRDANPEHAFVLPQGAVLPANGYAVICVDTQQVKLLYPRLKNVFGNLPFDFSNSGDTGALVDAAGRLVDSLTFADAPPWPVEADGEGYTLELLDPTLDRTAPSSWAASRTYGGTPGRANSRHAVAAKVAEQPPMRFELSQNYPNPFNAETRIRYALPSDGRVTVEVYDLLGRRTARLVDERQAAGFYEIRWQTSAASGVYFYRLTLTHSGGSETAVKKMLLVR